MATKKKAMEVIKLIKKGKLVYLAVAGGLMTMSLLGAGFELVYWQRAYPGVKLASVDVGGAGQIEVERIVKLSESQVKTLKLNWGTSDWKIETSEIGLRFDKEATQDRVLGIGRRGGLISRVREVWSAWLGRVEVVPVFELRDDKLNEAIAAIAVGIDIPAQEPEVGIDMNLRLVNVSTGENGQEVNQEELKREIVQAIETFSSWPIRVPVVAIQPKLTQSQVEITRARMEKLLDKKITVVFEAEDLTWEVGGELMAAWLDPVGTWKMERVSSWVDDLATTVDKPAQNASFTMTEAGKVQDFKPGKNGHGLRKPEVVEILIGTLSELEAGPEETAEVRLLVDETTPNIATGDVNGLGITELLGKGESWYAGSITNRIFNLHKAAETLNGVLIPPGETFSFNETVGEISTATGYKQAFIIKEGQTILGDGGGVCQTSSTLFRAILAAGLPIDSRTAHAYRVSYYEQNYQPGFDATVFQPAPDFKFTNDTDAHVLIQMEFDEKKKYLAFAIYGTSDGRKAEISKARVWDVVPPPPDLYVDDPSLPVGQTKQTEHAARGSKVAFDWKVTRGDEVLIERTFYSNYKPWQAVYLRGIKPN